MTFWILAYIGGFLTILSPCILPVLPFVFSRSEQPFYRSGLPLLLGMACTFALASTLAVVGGGWAVHANEWGRWIALVLLSFFAASLIFPKLSEKITEPLTHLGSKINQANAQDRSWGRSFVLGIATGLLWAPCAGPILGLILTGAALKGANFGTAALLLAYALGAATSLGLALLAGGKLLGVFRKYLGADEWVRKILGFAILIGVVAIAFGWDRTLLTQLSRVQTDSFEEKLLGFVHLNNSEKTSLETSENMLPEFSKDILWLNSPALTKESLRGKVVLIDFWTYSCINCLRTLPYVKAWAEKYKSSGLVVIGVHTPEFAFEKNIDNVKKAIQELGVNYPVAIDNDYKIWQSFDNEYWPAHYFIDAQGKIREHHFGEGEYEKSEKIIQKLLEENKSGDLPREYVKVAASGVEAASLGMEVESPETYLGYERAQNFVSASGLKEDQEQNYIPSKNLKRNQWTLGGNWKVQGERAELKKSSGKILFRFHARDLHLVLGSGADGHSVRFIVRIDGVAPKENHGMDVDAEGRGLVKDHRLYQLIRQKAGESIEDHTFDINFHD